VKNETKNIACFLQSPLPIIMAMEGREMIEN
jgi:hypothetical protein